MYRLIKKSVIVRDFEKNTAKIVRTIEEVEELGELDENIIKGRIEILENQKVYWQKQLKEAEVEIEKLQELLEEIIEKPKLGGTIG